MSENSNDRYDTMVEFIGTFPSLSGAPPADISELSDGVAMFEALSEIAPDHFDPSTIARHFGENWALKSSNLRKLQRNLEQFFHQSLQKDADFSFDINAIAKSSEKSEIASVVELLCAAAVTCDAKNEFVARIMTMSTTKEMKQLVTDSLARLSDYEGEEEDMEESELVFNDEDAGFSKDHLEETPTTPTANSADRTELEAALMDARRELAAHKSQAAIAEEESQAAEKKLRALLQDMQDRLVQRQEELIDAEEELRRKTSELDDTKAAKADLEEKNAQLADDLDVANSKALQLRKAEATVVAYRNKLEGVGVVSQQKTELEEQAASYLRQIMDLENETKKIPTMQKTIDDLQQQVAAADKAQTHASSSVKDQSAEIASLREKLGASENAKKMYEEELVELRATQDGGHLDDLGPAVAGLSLSDSAASSEKTMRLEIENQRLKEQLSQLQKGEAVSDDVGSLRIEVEKLKVELQTKEAEKKKLTVDKEKLEAYTKRTLAKFQEKYLVALQECKGKLKEKQDKIEVLEGRSASEKTAQKREERLISSTIYELGLAMMQNRLKER